MLEIGQPAPDFTLQSSQGGTVSLSSFRGKKDVVIFFYPADGSPGCTREVCSFRDAFAGLESKDVAVLGINSGSLASHQEFAKKQRLPFPLLVDKNDRARDSFEVARTAFIIPGRETFLVDRRGILRAKFSSQFRPDEHVTRIQSAIEALRKTK